MLYYNIRPQNDDGNNNNNVFTIGSVLRTYVVMLCVYTMTVQSRHIYYINLYIHIYMKRIILLFDNIPYTIRVQYKTPLV